MVTSAALAQHPQVPVWTAAYDNDRTGAKLHETVLNQQNVLGLRKIISYRLDDAVYTHPLVIPRVLVPGLRIQTTLLLTCTVRDSCYAFDAVAPSGASVQPLWRLHFANPRLSIEPVRASDVQKPGTHDFQDYIGVVGTPVIDTATHLMYVVARTREGAGYFTRLHSIAITVIDVFGLN